MPNLIFLLATLAALSRATPFPEPIAAPQGLSLPPLIPFIPGVTPPITSNAPPLPILQVPTPPLASPPFVGSDLKPKKIGYFWTASGNNQNKDFLAVYSLDDDTFGTFIWLTDVPSSGNSPHHLGVSVDGKTLIGGGLLSILKTQDTAYYFDTTDPYRPRFKKSNRAILSNIVDEIRAKPDGGFLITYMGSTAGTAPGRLVETNAQGDIIAEHPKVTDLSSTANILSTNFNPHGLSVDFKNNLILTSDFVVPLSILKPSLGIIRDDTLRLWSLNDYKIISTITIPNGGGIQDVKFVPGHPEQAAIATACTLGQVWAIYPNRIDPVTNARGTAELLFDLGPKARNEIAIYTDLTADGRFLYLTLTNANHIAALDISDFDNVKRLDDPNEDQPTIGPHYIKVTPDQKHIVVTDYFVQTGDIGIVNSPADFKALYIDILPNGALKFGRSIDFQKNFANRGGAKPHSSVVFDLTNPDKPVYY